MPDGVDDDFGFAALVEDEIRIWRRRQTPNGPIIRSDADVRMVQEKVDDGLNARLNTLRALWRIDGKWSRIMLRSASAGSV
jgi:hypothetical protein